MIKYALNGLNRVLVVSKKPNFIMGIVQRFRRCEQAASLQLGAHQINNYKRGGPEAAKNTWMWVMIHETSLQKLGSPVM